MTEMVAKAVLSMPAAPEKSRRHPVGERRRRIRGNGPFRPGQGGVCAHLCTEQGNSAIKTQAGAGCNALLTAKSLYRHRPSPALLPRANDLCLGPVGARTQF